MPYISDGLPKTTNSSPSRFRSVTPSDTDLLSDAQGIYTTRAIMVTAAGTVKVLGTDDTVAITTPSLAVGIWHLMDVKRIYATGTTATGIIAAL